MNIKSKENSIPREILLKLNHTCTKALYNLTLGI